MSQESFNEIYDRCNDPSRGKLTGKFLFDDFIAFLEEYRETISKDDTDRYTLKNV